MALGDSAHNSEVRENSDNPIKNTNLRPRRSASDPAVNNSDASVSA